MNRTTTTTRGVAHVGVTATVLTLVEAATFLKVSDRTLWQLASDDKIPHFKVGRQYRFVTANLLEWAGEKHSLEKGIHHG